MERIIINQANEIIELIRKNEKAIEELSKYADSGKTLYTKEGYPYSIGYCFSQSIDFENWEIRLMIHNKKQRIAALEKQLEKL